MKLKRHIARRGQGGGFATGPRQRYLSDVAEVTRDLVCADRGAAEGIPEAILGNDKDAWHRRQCAKRRRLSSGRVPGDAYYANTRADIVDALPRPVGSVLDVGCGSGGVGAGLRRAGATRLTGIEVVPEQAELARAHYDHVVAAPVEEALAQLDGPFDTILCLDVLEHLVDPEPVLQALLAVAAPGGRLHISIPNARHFTLLRDLLFRGTFGYTEYGHRDVTHLRWYTRRDLIALVSRCGWQVRACDGSFSGRDRYADKASFGRAREFLTVQWHLLATAP